MKTLYIDCGMGAAGDMLGAALLAAVGDATAAAVDAVLWRFPFDSERKFSACAVRLRDGRELTLIKGAPERLLADISGYMREKSAISCIRDPGDTAIIPSQISHDVAKSISALRYICQSPVRYIWARPLTTKSPRYCPFSLDGQSRYAS